MVSFLILSLLIYNSYANNLKRRSFSFSTDDVSHKISENTSNKFQYNSPKFLSAKRPKDFICDGNEQSTIINNENFQNTAKIASSDGCVSISVTSCTFTNIIIPDTSSANGQISIIYIKSIDFVIDESSFTNCYSNSKVQRTSPSILLEQLDLSLSNFPISDYIICHAIYLDENINHEVKITNCNFVDNGIPNDSDGTIIYSNKVNKLLIESTKFESNTISSRAIETFNSQNIEVNSVSFKKMKGPKGSNGGALLIQFANNVTIIDSTFDSNTLQPGDGTTTNLDVYGSAFFINLNDILSFTNNTITNHETFLSSVITFNKNELSTNSELTNNDNFPIKRKVTIFDSKFISNSYSQAPDGNGVGIFIEDYSENLPETEENTEPYFLQIEFSSCIFNNNGNTDCTSSVLGWTRKTSFISFINCNFESNTAAPGSTMFNILNGLSINFELCQINKLKTQSFLHFTPLTTSKQNTFIKHLEATIASCTFSNDDTIQNHFVYTEGATVYDSILNLINISFTDVLLGTDNFIIKSESSIFNVINCDFVYTKSQVNHAIMSNRLDSNITVTDSKFQNCKYAINLAELAEKLTITNCDFIDCKNDQIIEAYAKSYFAENCQVSLTTPPSNGYYGMKVDQAMNIEIINSSFKNTGKSAIRCFYDLDSSTITVRSCTIRGCGDKKFAFHTKNKVINFINSSIINEKYGQGSNGFCAETVAEVTIDECKFINCFYNGNNNVGGAITCINSNPNPRESYTISNTEFTGCSAKNSIIYLVASLEVPRFINVVISKTVSNYLFNVAVPKIAQGVVPTGVFLFQNVSFIDIENTANAGGGIGFWFQPQTTADSDYTLSFYDCRFQNTRWSGTQTNALYGGGAISIESPNTRNFHISIILCAFYNTSVKENHGGAIAVISKKSITISDIYIENSSVLVKSSSNGGCIYANEDGEAYDFHLINVTINGSISNCGTTAVSFASRNRVVYTMVSCSFLNCNKEVASDSSIIHVPLNSKEFQCSDTNFIFNESTSTNSRGAEVHSPKFSFENCYFCKCGRSSKLPFGGGIYYDEPKNLQHDEKIDVSLCTFEQCCSENSGALRLNIYNGLPSLYNNTFLDITSNYIVALVFKENVIFSHIELNKQYFIRCNNLMADGGGSGVWVNNHRADGNIYPTYIDFVECEFIENVATKCGGGAFGIGTSTSVRPTELNFLNCRFIGNSCIGSDGGGAIWIRTSIPSYVSSCVFKDNRAGNETASLNGGAIYIRYTTSVPQFYLSDSEFINNSCVNPSSSGHIIFGIYLFSIMKIDNCQFYDNGIDGSSSNSLIYTNSNLQVQYSTFSFTNKENSNSRALYIGSSSELNLYYCDFINCTDPSEKAGSIYYEIISSRPPLFVELSYCNFDRNTEGTKSSEMYFYVLDPPSIHDCTFKNEDTLSDLIIINFDESVKEIEPLRYAESPALACTDSNLNHNFIIGYFENLDRHIEIEDFTMSWWRLFNCKDFSIIDNNVIDFFIFGSNLNNNTNDGIFFPFGIEGTLEIEDCVFKNNKMKSTPDSSLTGTVCIEKASDPKIMSTSFQNEEIEENGFVLKSLVSLDLNEVYILNCPQNAFSILLDIDKSAPSSALVMDSCIVNESGQISIENRIDRIELRSSLYGNSHSGFHYKPEASESQTNSIEITGTTFDNFTNYALYLTIYGELVLSNNTLKNCDKVDENENSPFFELDLKSGAIDQISFEKFIFENNRFNNSNDRLINGGGTGLFITFPDLGKDNDKIIFIEFIECQFISNNAVHHGGAFAFISGTDGVVISGSTIYTSFSFKDCTFSQNSCNKLRGHALYIEASNVTIEGCLFDSHSSGTEKADTDYKDVLQSSVVYIATAKNDSFSIQNCSFLNNKASSLYILNCEDEITIADCLFESNDIMSISSTFSGKNDIITDDIVSSSIITIITAKDSITVDNCTFLNNSEDSGDDGGEIIRASTIFANTLKSFTMKSTNFFDNNINDLILVALFDVSITDCRFVGLENSSLVVGCALVIRARMKVDLIKCSFSGYSSSVYNQQNSEARVLCPIQIESNHSVSLTDIEVFDVSGDVFKITSNESVTVSNCIFDSNSSDADSEIENSQQSEVAKNCFMICCCEKSVAFNSLRISNYDKGLLLKKGTSLSIENSAFSQLKNSVIINEIYDQISLEKVDFIKCSNSEADGGGIGFVISPLDSITAALKITVEFNNCNFESNSASGSGGALHLTCSSNSNCNILSFESVSFNSCIFRGNKAAVDAGALSITTQKCRSITVSNCNFTMNEADSNIGAVRVDCTCHFLLDSCIFINNTAKVAAAENQMIARVDSLYLAASSSSEVVNTNFTKAVFIDEECGYQAVFVNRIEGGKEIISLHNCLFSNVNPITPQVLFIATVTRSNTTVTRSSFTHFYAYTEESELSEQSTALSFAQPKSGISRTAGLARSNLSAPFYHTECNSDSQVTFVDCCFDSSRSNALSPTTIKRSLSEASGGFSSEKVKLIRDVGEVEKAGSVTFVNSEFESDVCVFPSIVTDLIHEITDGNNAWDKRKNDGKNKSRRLLIIGLSVGAAALVVIASIIIVCVVVYKRKHKEMKKTMEYDDDCQPKLEQEEINALNMRYNQNDYFFSTKSSKVENLDSADECEETDMEEFDF